LCLETHPIVAGELLSEDVRETAAVDNQFSAINLLDESTGQFRVTTVCTEDDAVFTHQDKRVASGETG
jgi:hypothetical protein